MSSLAVRAHKRHEMCAHAYKRDRTPLIQCDVMARPKRQEDPLLPVPLPRRRPSRANTRALATWVKPELVHEINALAQDEQTSVSALLEEAAINLLRERGIEFPDYMRHYRKDATEVAP